MKRLALAALAASVLVSCGTDEYRIHGTVEDPSLDGAIIFLVPVGDESVEGVDSTIIAGGKFEFRGNELMMKEIRIQKKYRYGSQNLLVVTEPGDINVTIGAVSSGGGTPQNDSLQIWKDMRTAYSQEIRKLVQSGKKAEADSLMHAHKARTLQIAENAGPGPLRDFLRKLYPQP